MLKYDCYDKSFTEMLSLIILATVRFLTMQWILITLLVRTSIIFRINAMLETLHKVKSTFHYLVQLISYQPRFGAMRMDKNCYLTEVFNFQVAVGVSMNSGKRVPLQVAECNVQGTRCKAGGHVFAAGCDCTPPDRPTPCPPLPTFHPHRLHLFWCKVSTDDYAKLMPAYHCHGGKFSICLFVRILT